MQFVRLKSSDASSGSRNNASEKREKNLLTYVIRATARDQEKNILISRLQREMSKAAEHRDALETEVKLKDKILHVKEDELSTVKSENEALKRQMQRLLTEMGDAKFNSNKNSPKLTGKKASLKRSETIGSKFDDNKPSALKSRIFRLKRSDTNVLKFNDNISSPLKSGNANLRKAESLHVGTPPMSPTLGISRKRSMRKSKHPSTESTLSVGSVSNLFYNLRKKSRK